MGVTQQTGELIVPLANEATFEVRNLIAFTEKRRKLRHDQMVSTLLNQRNDRIIFGHSNDEKILTNYQQVKKKRRELVN